MRFTASLEPNELGDAVKILKDKISPILLDWHPFPWGEMGKDFTGTGFGSPQKIL